MKSCNPVCDLSTLLGWNCVPGPSLSFVSSFVLNISNQKGRFLCTWLFCSNRERSIPLRGRHQLSMQMCRYNACLPLNPCYLFAKMNQRCLLNIDRHTYNWDNIDEYVLVPSKDYIEKNMTCADINFQMKPCMFRSVFCSMSRMWSANFCVAKTWWCM